MMLLSIKRYFHHSSRILTAITKTKKSALSDLRKSTGFSFINCKKALELFNYDITRAEEWLHGEAQREGWAKVGRLQNRPMSQGLVGLIHDGQRATLVEVNCETDFVAKNEKFQRLVSRLAIACHTQLSSSGSGLMTELDKSAVSGITLDDKSTISDLVATEVGVIGENMVARRAVHMCASPGTTISAYTHIAANDIVQIDKCKFGKYAALLEYRPVKADHDSPLSDATIGDGVSLDEAARNICQHIAGLNPLEIGEAPVVDEKHAEISEIGSDKNPTNVEIYLDDVGDVGGVQMNDEDRKLEQELGMTVEYDGQEMSDQIREEIGVFEVTDVDADEVDTARRVRQTEEQETGLLRQKFLLDETVTVDEYLRENELEVLRFVRYECGEEVEERRT